MNNCCLTGRLASEPEIKYTPSGNAVCNFRIAVDRIVKSGQPKEADFIPIVCWRQTAEFCANYLHKGALVGVEGTLQIRRWQTQQGDKRTTAEVVATRVQALGPKPKAADGEGPSADVPADVPADDFDPFGEDTT